MATPIISGSRAVQGRAELIVQNINRAAALMYRKEDHHIQQKESAMSERELKAENNRDNFEANLEPGLKVQNAPEAKKVAQLKTEERKALERKVCEPKEESEELVLTGSEESEEDVTLQYLEIIDLMELNNKRYQYKMEKMKEKIDGFKHQTDRLREKQLMNSNLTEQKQERLKDLVEYSAKNSIRKIVRQCSEKMAETCSYIFGHFWRADSPSIMAPHIEELSLNMLEDMTPKTHVKKQKQLLKNYDELDRIQREINMEARREERRQKRQEVAFAPPVKVTRQKPMPHKRGTSGNQEPEE